MNYIVSKSRDCYQNGKNKHQNETGKDIHGRNFTSNVGNRHQYIKNQHQHRENFHQNGTNSR